MRCEGDLPLPLSRLVSTCVGTFGRHVSWFLAAVFALGASVAGQEVMLRRDTVDRAFGPGLDRRNFRLIGADSEPSASVDFRADMVRIPRDALIVTGAAPASAQRFRMESVLPIQFGVLNASTGATAVSVTTFRPKATSSGVFLRDGEGYRADLVLSLVADEPTSSPILPQPVVLSVHVQGGTATPAVIRFTRIDEFQQVSLTIPVARDAVVVSIEVQQADVQPVRLEFGTQRGRLTLSVTPREILGYGLGVAKVSLEGDELIEAGTAVLLEADSGHLDPVRPVLDERRGATVSLRSAGAGFDRVRAPTWVGEPVELRYVVPVAFFAFALFGGVLGAALRVFRVAARSWRRALLVGTGAGILGAVLWALGLRVLTIDFTPAVTEFAAFGISALVGLGLGTFWQPAKK
ncbi:MAG: hypothetical protein AB7I19_12585 [Planctomycetota bacterium]